jgi:hypothetical protein
MRTLTTLTPKMAPGTAFYACTVQHPAGPIRPYEDSSSYAKTNDLMGLEPEPANVALTTAT